MGSQKVTIATNGPVDPQAIPAYAINNLAGPLIQKVAKYFEDPKVQAAFDRWKQEQAVKEATAQ